MAKHSLPLDEINALTEYVKVIFDKRADGSNRPEEDAEDIIDELLDLYLLAYQNGANYANETLGETFPIREQKLENALFKRFQGEDFRDRVRRYVNEGTVNDIVRVADTDSHRIYNAGVIDTASESNRILYKRWNTMLDEKVRDTHSYLENMSVPLQMPFYTYDGDSAMAPGDFTLPSNNANCRCVVDIISQ